jgi:hypothetical protein
MSKLKSTLAMICLFALAIGTVGCGSKAESTPNPDFKVPEIPKGERKMPGEGGKKS